MELIFGPGLLFRNAVLGGLLVALVCSLLGVYVVLRRMVLLGVALPQAGAAGIAAAFWLTSHAHDPGGGHTGALVGSLLATFGALGLVLGAQRGGHFPAEWATGALFAMASAATVLFVSLNPTGDLEVTNLLRGELLAMSDTDLAVLAFASFVALFLFFAFQREILLASFDPEFARTVGHRPARADALLFLLLGGAIAVGVMKAGPLVVFGFLVLPALAALRVAPGLRAALAISTALGALCSVGGFELAYRIDLPTGPTSVALAAACWLTASAYARLSPRLRRVAKPRIAALMLLVSLTVGGVLSCGLPLERGPAQSVPSSPAALPDLALRPPVAVARFQNETGAPLRVPSGNPLKEIERAARPSDGPAWTVADALQAHAVQELTRCGVAVKSIEESRSALPNVPSDPKFAAHLAREAGLEGPVLFGSLHRFTVTRTGLLLVRLELALVDPVSEELLWTGSARRPVSVESALTTQEILLDAAPSIFAEAFGRCSPPNP